MFKSKKYHVLWTVSMCTTSLCSKLCKNCSLVWMYKDNIDGLSIKKLFCTSCHPRLCWCCGAHHIHELTDGTCVSVTYSSCFFPFRVPMECLHMFHLKHDLRVLVLPLQLRLSKMTEHMQHHNWWYGRPHKIRRLNDLNKWAYIYAHCVFGTHKIGVF